jgi:hypothetical protein
MDTGYIYICTLFWWIFCPRFFCSPSQPTFCQVGFFPRTGNCCHTQVHRCHGLIIGFDKFNKKRGCEYLVNKQCVKPIICHYILIGLGTEFRSEKIPRNRLGTVSVIPRKKVLIPRHSEFRGRASSEARNGTESC